jgi:DNA repair protein RadC
MSISQWPADDRPREKLFSKGAESLSDAELLAIFLRIGVRGKSAVELARDLLAKFGSLAGIIGASFDSFCSVPGLGGAKFAQLHAAKELIRRALMAEMEAGVNLSSPTAVRDFLRISIQDRQVEVFVGLFLDAQNRVIAVDELFSGTLTQTSVFPREIVRKALQYNEPSHADETLTRTLKEALALVDVRVLDHFVVGRGATMSFAERGLL